MALLKQKLRQQEERIDELEKEKANRGSKEPQNSWKEGTLAHTALLAVMRDPNKKDAIIEELASKLGVENTLNFKKRAASAGTKLRRDIEALNRRLRPALYPIQVINGLLHLGILQK